MSLLLKLSSTFKSKDKLREENQIENCSHTEPLQSHLVSFFSSPLSLNLQVCSATTTLSKTSSTTKFAASAEMKYASTVVGELKTHYALGSKKG